MDKVELFDECFFVVLYFAACVCSWFSNAGNRAESQLSGAPKFVSFLEVAFDLRSWLCVGCCAPFFMEVTAVF